MKVIRGIVLIVCILTITACAAPTPAPSPTPLPSPTIAPSLTPTLEPTITPTPTQKPTKTPIPPTETQPALDFLLPTGEPVSEWEGIPVMPGAIAGDGDSQSYSFATKASPDDVQKYYEKEMAKIGWNFLAAGQGETNAVILIFVNESGTASVSIVPQPEDIVIVLLVK